MSQDLMDDLADGPRTAKRSVSVFTIVGLLLMSGGIGTLGYVGYEYFGTNLMAQKAFDEQRSTLRTEWDNDPVQQDGPGDDRATAPQRVPGDAIALLRIPRLGEEYEVPVLTGTDPSTLARGVGWYDSSVRPGQVGNFALAGHRVTRGEPFRRILEVRKGDEVIVETREAIHTYVMDTSPADLTVSDRDTWVLDPVPGKQGQPATQALITVTTCQDLFHSADRSIGFGHLATSRSK